MKSSCGGNSCPLSVFTEGESHAEEAQGAGSHALREMTCSHVDKEKLIFHCLMPCSHKLPSVSACDLIQH